MLKKITTDTNFGQISVEIRGGKIQVLRGVKFVEDSSGLQLLSSPDNVDPSMAIWKEQLAYRSGDRTIRSGNGLVGVFKDFNPEYPFLDDYIETDTIHSASCINLAINIFERYPEIFNLEEKYRIVSFIKDHDLGESENGDKPDDGSTSKEEKFETELAEFIKKIQYHTEKVQEILIRDFIIFEHAGSLEWDERDREILEFAKLIDKTDALLSSFIYETQGRNGSLLYKKKHFGGISERDQFYADQIGEYSQAGVWTAHMIDNYKEYKYMKLFLDIAVAACRDVRGEVFPWLQEFLRKRDVFTERERGTYIN